MIDHPDLCAMVAMAAITTPGPTMLLAFHNGSRGGLAHAVRGVTGAVASDLLLIAAVAAGQGSLLAASSRAFEILKWIGVAYLCWLGLRRLLQPRPQQNHFNNHK